MQASKTNTSRIRQKMTLETDDGSLTGGVPESDFTRNNLTGNEKTARASGSATSTGSNGNFTIKANFKAKDPLTPQFATPTLNASTSLNITENRDNGTLRITGQVSGDNFPSAEAFVSDAAGNSLFMGVFTAQGGILDLYGDNQNQLINISMTIQIDSDGNFTGVTVGDNTYTIDEWNELFSSQNSGQ